MIVSSCYLSSVKIFPHGKTENQMDYGWFFSCLKESYMTQAKKNGETAPDNHVSIHSNNFMYIAGELSASWQSSTFKNAMSVHSSDLLVARSPDTMVCISKAT